MPHPHMIAYGPPAMRIFAQCRPSYNDATWLTAVDVAAAVVV